MIYLADITTPANTPKSSPLKTVLKVTKGLVYRIEIEFPPGPSGLLFVSVKDGGVAIWPTGSNEAFRGDDNQINFDDIYLKDQPPYKFDIYTYNLDDTYEHSVRLRIGMVSKEVFLARFIPSYGYDYLVAALDKLQADRDKLSEEKRQEVLGNPFPWVPEEEE